MLNLAESSTLLVCFDAILGIENLISAAHVLMRSCCLQFVEKTCVACATEKDVFVNLGLEYLEPHERNW
jgi:hypothetical protein